MSKNAKVAPSCAGPLAVICGKQGEQESKRAWKGIQTKTSQKECGAKLRNNHGESAHMDHHDLAAGMLLRHFVRVAKEMDWKSIGLCPQGLESPRCRFGRPLARSFSVALMDA